jgi:hypothetical protein
MNLLKYILISLAASLLLSCSSSTHIYDDYVKGTDFKSYKSYAWLPVADTARNNSLLDNEIMKKNLHLAVNSEMGKLGFQVDTMKPDLLVLAHTMFQKVKDTVTTPMYSSYPYYSPGYYPGVWYPYYYPGYYNYTYINGYNISTVNFTEGTIVIDFIDRKTKSLVWRGWAVDNIYNPKQFQNNLPRKVHGILKKYPSPPAGK